MNESFLYVFHCEGFHKVGISKTPNFRLSSLQAMNPYPITLVLYRRVRAEDARRFEMKIHALLRPYRLHGEWFSAPLPVIRKAAEMASRILPLTAAAQAKFVALCEANPGATRKKEFRVKAAEIRREIFDAEDIQMQ